MSFSSEIEQKFSFLGKELTSKIIEVSSIISVNKDKEIISEGQYIQSVPIVLEGLVKVVTRQEDKELLLYYLQPQQGCIMSFSACLNEEKSKIYAITEENSKIILIPGREVTKLIKEFPIFNYLFYNQFYNRYLDLVDTINNIIFEKLDTRLLKYLKDKIQLTGKNPISITHREIATDLGSAREVITRLIKKLERENKLKQHKDSIEIIF